MPVLSRLQEAPGNPQQFVSRDTYYEDREYAAQSRGVQPEVRVHSNNSSYIQQQALHVQSQGVNRLGALPSRSRHENCLVSQVDHKTNDIGNNDHKVSKPVEKRPPQKQQKDDILLKYPGHKYYVERGVKHSVRKLSVRNRF